MHPRRAQQRARRQRNGDGKGVRRVGHFGTGMVGSRAMGGRTGFVWMVCGIFDARKEARYSTQSGWQRRRKSMVWNRRAKRRRYIRCNFNTTHPIPSYIIINSIPIPARGKVVWIVRHWRRCAPPSPKCQNPYTHRCGSEDTIRANQQAEFKHVRARLRMYSFRPTPCRWFSGKASAQLPSSPSFSIPRPRSRRARRPSPGSGVPGRLNTPPYPTSPRLSLL